MSYGPPPGPPHGGGYGPPPGGSGGYPGQQMGGAPPNNWLVPAILSIFCCWPLAIPAIIFATKVNAQWNIGDYAGADDAAKKAKMFSLIGIIVGVVWYVVVGLFYIFVFAAAATSASYSTY